MLSREHMTNPAAAERRSARVGPTARRDGNDVFPVGRVWAKLAMLALLVGLFGAFLLLNRGAVIEPRLHLVFASYERPGLLVVMLLTSLATVAGVVLLRTVLGALRQLRQAKSRTPISAARPPIAGMNVPVVTGQSSLS